MTTTSRAYEPLVGESVSVPGKSAWDCLLLVRDEIQGRPLAVWESPGETYVGIGAARRIETSGTGRFREARERLEALVQGRSVGIDPPAALGGFSFAAGEPGAWPGFPELSLVIPEEIIHQRADVVSRTRWIASSASRQAAGTPGPGHAPASPPRSESIEPWTEAVRRTLGRIAEGSLLKAVLARSRTVTLASHQSPLTIYESIRRAYPSCFCFLIDDGAGNAFLGASPECLVQEQGLVAQSDAVAGTLRCGPGDDTGALARTLLESAKDCAEHELVVRHLVEAFTPICNSVHSHGPEVMRLPHLLHIRTRVTGITRNAHLLDLVSRIHPTPAVAGTPRAEALDWIRHVEGGPRGWYGGGVGFVRPQGDGIFAVGIRSIAIRGNEARVFAGAGIVEGSDPEQEWNETELKMQGMLDAIARG